jgi:hypothetical protein
VDDDTSKAHQLEWLQAWRRAGAKMASLREESLRSVSTPQALQNLSGAFESARLQHSPQPSSGLVEQQAWFARWRRG